MKHSNAFEQVIRLAQPFPDFVWLNETHMLSLEEGSLLFDPLATVDLDLSYFDKGPRYYGASLARQAELFHNYHVLKLMESDPYFLKTIALMKGAHISIDDDRKEMEEMKEEKESEKADGLSVTFWYGQVYCRVCHWEGYYIYPLHIWDNVIGKDVDEITQVFELVRFLEETLIYTLNCIDDLRYKLDEKKCTLLIRHYAKDFIEFAVKRLMEQCDSMTTMKSGMSEDKRSLFRVKREDFIRDAVSTVRRQSMVGLIVRSVRADRAELPCVSFLSLCIEYQRMADARVLEDDRPLNEFYEASDERRRRIVGPIPEIEVRKKVYENFDEWMKDDPMIWRKVSVVEKARKGESALWGVQEDLDEPWTVDDRTLAFILREMLRRFARRTHCINDSLIPEWDSLEWKIVVDSLNDFIEWSRGDSMISRREMYAYGQNVSENSLLNILKEYSVCVCCVCVFRPKLYKCDMNGLCIQMDISENPLKQSFDMKVHLSRVNSRIDDDSKEKSEEPSGLALMKSRGTLWMKLQKYYEGCNEEELQMIWERGVEGGAEKADEVIDVIRLSYYLLTALVRRDFTNRVSKGQPIRTEFSVSEAESLLEPFALFVVDEYSVLRKVHFVDHRQRPSFSDALSRFQETRV